MKVMTTLSDMVLQCGGGGCCVLEQCFRYSRRTREPRDCGCQFALLHRADTAWPSVFFLFLSFCSFVWLNRHLFHLYMPRYWQVVILREQTELSRFGKPRNRYCEHYGLDDSRQAPSNPKLCCCRCPLNLLV